MRCAPSSRSPATATSRRWWRRASIACAAGSSIFPHGSALPYRLDLFDAEIESIRSFDADTQRTLYKVAEIRLLPAREFPMDEAGRNQFRRSFRDSFEGDPSRSRIYKDVSNGVAPAGIEYYLPLFFERTATIFDYLPKSATVCMHGEVHAALSEFWHDAQGRPPAAAGRFCPAAAAADGVVSQRRGFFRARESLRARGVRERRADRRIPCPIWRWSGARPIPCTA